MKYEKTTVIEIDGIEDLPDEIFFELEQELIEKIHLFLSSTDGSVCIGGEIGTAFSHVRSFLLVDLCREFLDASWRVDEEKENQKQSLISTFESCIEVLRGSK